MHAQSIKNRFAAVNRERLRRIQLSLRSRQRDFIELLPLLFHINNDTLPGFVTEDTPCGIPDYQPGKAAIEAVQRIDKKFRFRKRALRHYDIYALYLTGSSGSIAYSEKSDFDIWLCHKPGLADERLAALRRKADMLTAWATTLDLEVHFFLMDEESFRNYEHGHTSEESSGSAQHHLLLEEFYRTGLLVAGRYPAWWLVPVEEEHRYGDYLDELKRSRAVPEYEFLDFGSIAHIPAEEFFGASLWQIFKGIDSPYKAVLKILLMETYASEYPHPELLCQRYKRAIHGDNLDLNDIDPYIMMCNKVEEYLLGNNELRRLELARRCFYFKTGIHLSEPQPANREPDWRQSKLQDMVNNWGWDHAQLLMLDSRINWKIHRVIEERRVLVDELMQSYQLLSRFARQYASLALIDQRDMNVLGRKLYAAFERKAGKIDTINPDISANLIEPKLSIRLVQSIEQHDSWLLYRGHINTLEAGRTTPLRRATNLVDLLAWCHFNHLVGPSTVITLNAYHDRITTREMRDILRAIQRRFNGDCLQHARLADLDRPSKLVNTALFINTGIDPMQLAHQANRTVVSNRNNALSYSGFLENLVCSIEQISITSWNEVYVTRYEGVDGILDCLAQYVGSALKSPGFVPMDLAAYSFSSAVDHTVTSRISQLFNNATAHFCASDARRVMRYVVGVEDKYYILQRDHDALSHARAGSREELFRELSVSQEEFQHVVFDEQTLKRSPVPVIYTRNKPDFVQLFYHRDGSAVDVYILDENGSLFSHRQAYYDAHTLLGQFDRFLYTIHNRRHFTSEQDAPVDFGSCIEYYEVLVRDGRFICQRAKFSPAQTSRRYLEISAIIESSGGDPVYRFYCGDDEYSTLQFGAKVFDEVARAVLSKRAGNANYPMYITDIDFTGDMSALENLPGHNSTIRYLHYKSVIEAFLNQACDRVRTPVTAIEQV